MRIRCRRMPPQELTLNLIYQVLNVKMFSLAFISEINKLPKKLNIDDIPRIIVIF